MAEEKKEARPTELLSGTLNILGLKIDLGELLQAPEELSGRLEELREKLKAAGGKAALSDEEWRKGGTSVSGHIRTRGLLGEQEFHVGTMGKARNKASGRPAPAPTEVVEPPMDVFYEAQQVTIVADVPGASLEDLELRVEGRVFSLSARPTARRNYRKELHLEADVTPESLQATCRNGVLEVRLNKQGAKGQ
jgi:HSP20 family molecular chaperone IbpA